MPSLLLGPLLRHVDETSATVWVETDRAGEVVVSAGSAEGRARTTAVQGHHYALVVVTGLAPATATPYAVRLDDEELWPDPTSGRPPSVIRTADATRPLRVSRTVADRR